MANRFFGSGDGSRRPRTQPLTRKEIIWQMGICLAILAFFQVKDMFFPKTSVTATPAPSAVEEQTGIASLDAAAVESLKLALPVIDHSWNVYVVEWNGARSYTVTSTNLTGITVELLAKAGYDVGATVRINVKDIDALTALFKKLPTGDALIVIGANGFSVDGTLYAQLGNAANKGGLKISMGTWSGPVITPLPSVSPTPKQ